MSQEVARENRTVVLSVKVTPAEKEQLRRLAFEKRVTVSTLAHRLLFASFFETSAQEFTHDAHGVTDTA